MTSAGPKERAAQYYTFQRLGHEGFRQVQQECRDVATHSAERIAQLDPFRLLARGDELPVFAFKLSDEAAGAGRADPETRDGRLRPLVGAPPQALRRSTVPSSAAAVDADGFHAIVRSASRSSAC